MRVLITGVTGPVGSALAAYLTTLPEAEVHVVKRWRSNIRPIEAVLARCTVHEADVEDPFAVDTVMRRVQPEGIFHLAAQSYPSASWDAPVTTLRTNVEGTVNVLEAARRHCPKARIHIAGSSAAYGPVLPENTPIKESEPLRPVSPYGVSKAAAEMIAFQYHASFGLQTMVTRGFIQVGPYQGERTAVQTFCQQMALIEAGRQEPVIMVGNLDAYRDFIHAEDGSRALWLLLQRGTPGEVYNMCSGQPQQIKGIVDLVCQQGKVPVEIRIDPARLRPADEPILVGDNSKLRHATGWEPQKGMDAIVADILGYWRDRV